VMRIRKDVKKPEPEVTSWYLKVSFIILAAAAVIISPRFETAPGEEEKELVEVVRSLPEGSKVLIAVNYGPSARYEIEGAFQLIFRELLSRNIGVIFFTLSEMGVESTSMGIRESLSGFSFREGGAIYGKDYVNLGFFAGGILGAGMVSRSLGSSRSVDVFDNSINDLPIMNGIVSMSDLAAFIEFSAMKTDGTPGAAMLDVFSMGKGIPSIAVVTSDMVPEYLPFRNSERINILIGGSSKMAALESAFGVKGILTSRHSVASILLVFIMFTIVLSNIKLLIQGRK
jgi:hypothetical protein